MPFLYFPEDKSEYIPAAISFVFFMIIFVLLSDGFDVFRRNKN